MRKRLLLLAELLFRPVLVVGLGGIAVLGNIDTILSHFPWVNTFVSGTIMSEPLKSILQWFAANWEIVFWIAVSSAIFEGFYRKTSKYLGDTVTAKVEIVIPREPSYNRIVIKVINNEVLNLERCCIKIDSFLYLGKRLSIRPVEIQTNSQKLQWMSTPSTDGYASIHGSGGSEEIGLVSVNGDRFVIMYHGYIPSIPPTNHGLQSGIYTLRIRLDGYLGEKQIEFTTETFKLDLLPSMLLIRPLLPSDESSKKKSVPLFLPKIRSLICKLQTSARIAIQNLRKIRTQIEKRTLIKTKKKKSSRRKTS